MTALAHNAALREPLTAWSLCARSAAVVPLGRGNINDTWRIDTNERRVVLQRINGRVFSAPERVVDNLRTIAAHIAKREGAATAGFVIPQLIATRDGNYLFRDRRGECWRAMGYIEHLPAPTALDEQVARSLGRVLARYHELTATLDPTALALPLPGFHVTPRYLQLFDQARAATTEPLHDLRDCLDFVDRHRKRTRLLEDAAERGLLRRRVIHGDPKLDNVIFSRQGGACGLFDLDTAGPGLLQYDLGDCLRSACNRTGEVPEGGAAVTFDLDICEAVLKGYLEVGEGQRAAGEMYYLADGVFTITFELGLRFLTDHLQGDRYFRVAVRGENLGRSRVQFRLAASILEQEERLRRLAASISPVLNW